MEICARWSIPSSGSLWQFESVSKIRGISLPGLQNAHGQWRRSRAPFVMNALPFGEEDVAWQPFFRLDPDSFWAEAPFLRKQIEDVDWKEKVEELRAAALGSLPTGNEATDCNPTSWSQVAVDDRRNKNDDRGPDLWIAACTGLAVALFQCGTAIAQESLENSESAEAAARAPSWLVPAVLAFPVLSYVLFNVYRDQVNPYAKLTDWMFGVAAVVIIANLILISTIGVRLY